MFTHSNHLTGGAEIHVASGPDHGPALLMFHGVMRSWRSFAPIWPALLPRWRVHAVDHRGHGTSSRGQRYLVSDYLDDALSIVEKHVSGPIVLYGHSLGALVSAGVAAALHDRVVGVILEDPPSPAFLADPHATMYGALFAAMQRLAHDSSASVSELTQRLAAVELPGGVRLGSTRDAASVRLSARMLRDLDPDTLTPLIACCWLAGMDFMSILGHVRCPVLLLRADERTGGMLNPDGADRMMDVLHDGYRIDFPGMSHQLHWVATDAVLRGVSAFLESLREDEP